MNCIPTSNYQHYPINIVFFLRKHASGDAEDHNDEMITLFRIFMNYQALSHQGGCSNPQGRRCRLLQPPGACYCISKSFNIAYLNNVTKEEEERRG
jgi:hypothetical protein